MVLPNAYGPTEVSTLSTGNPGVGVKGTITVSVVGGVSFESAVPILVKLPASISGWVTVCVPRSEERRVGTGLGPGLLLGVRPGSLTLTLVRVVLPVLVAVTV